MPKYRRKHFISASSSYAENSKLVSLWNEYRVDCLFHIPNRGPTGIEAQRNVLVQFL